MKKSKKETYTTSKWTLKKPLYLEKTDKRYKKHVVQLKKFGFSNAETWGLYSVIAEFILPRLKDFKKTTMSYPMGISEEEWNNILEKMIFAFEWTLTCENGNNLNLSEEESKINWDRHKEGIDLFSKWFMDLWW